MPRSRIFGFGRVNLIKKVNLTNVLERRELRLWIAPGN